MGGTAEQKMKGNEPMGIRVGELAEVYEAHFDDIFKFVYRRIPNKQMAEDLTHDTFFAALKKGKAFLEYQEPKLWLMVTAKNKMHELFRRMGRWATEPLEEECPDLAVTENSYEKIELELTALAMVSDEEWMLIKKYYLYGATIAELAEAYNITENNMRVRLSRLKKKLRDKIER